jgi:hypothetical protein
MALVEGYQLKSISRSEEDFKYINSRMIKTLSVHHNNGVKLESYEISQVPQVYFSMLFNCFILLFSLFIPFIYQRIYF